MDFHNKETYLQAVAEWVANYNELSQKIRDARAAYHDAQRAGKSVYSVLGELEGLRERATQELGERAWMKQEAHRQVTERKALQASA